ncbi:restriction endonuclease subunit S [Herbaspirillum sp.]|uniref:restriction endonuclease subunit S n=1 Tax=Herbaspirillum sp. TaxID=1890675 RepID=UPI0031CE5DCF
MSLPGYSEYKDSGLDWLGQVPAHWPIRRLRFVAELNPSKAELAGIDRATEVSFLPMEAIGEDGSIQLERTRTIAEVETGYTYFRDGDVTLAKITPCFENGKGALMQGLTAGIGFGTTELIVARPKVSQVLGTMLNWIFRSPNFRAQGEASMYGAGGQKRVPDDFVRNLAWALPPLGEQTAIAVFLNQETAKIDALIAEQEKLIVLLAEKRQATISHAVTKGLSPNALMRDSGVAWLGEVPAHWEMKRLKDCGCEVVDCKNRTPEPHDDGDYFVVRTSCVKDGQFHPEPGYQTDEANFIEWTAKGRPRAGDVLFTREAPTGEACLAPEGLEFCLGQRMMYIRPLERVLLSEFLLYSIYGGLARERISEKSKGSTVGHLRVGEVGELPLLLPPLDEQREVIAVIGEELSKLKALTTAAQHAIALMKERRSALIVAAVTGQIDVRGAGLQLAAETIEAITA